MATTIITVRTDEQIKQEAQELFANLGLDMSSAVNVFLRAAIKANGIPFVVTDEPDEEYKDHIKRTLAERKEKAKDPDTIWYSTDDLRKMFGLEKS